MDTLENLWHAIGGLLLIILCIEVLPDVWKRASRYLRYGRENKPDYRALAEAYENAEWVAPYYVELSKTRLNWAPHVGGVAQAYSSPGLNIDNDGLRRTWNAPYQNDSITRIHAYGGSTMMGVGVRDDWTLPSLLSKKLTYAGHCVEVVNFAQSSYNAMQEFIAFSGHIADGKKGDLAIFLDGLNEAIAAEQNGIAGTVFNAAIRADELNLMQPWRRWDLLRHALNAVAPRTMRRVQTLGELINPTPGNGAGSFKITPERIDPLSREVVSHYVGTLQMIRAIAEDNAIKTLFFWQPSLFTKQTLSDHEERYKNDSAPVPELRGDLFRSIYATLKADPGFRSIPGAIDVSDIFDDKPTPLFTDPFHLAEKGNNALADAMLPHVIRSLEARKD